MISHCSGTGIILYVRLITRFRFDGPVAASIATYSTAKRSERKAHGAVPALPELCRRPRSVSEHGGIIWRRVRPALVRPAADGDAAQRHGGLPDFRRRATAAPPPAIRHRQRHDRQ